VKPTTGQLFMRQQQLESKNVSPDAHGAAGDQRIALPFYSLKTAYVLAHTSSYVTKRYSRASETKCVINYRKSALALQLSLKARRYHVHKASQKRCQRSKAL
jgi:hypothetical protein